jgi:putative polyketide hydroxylase
MSTPEARAPVLIVGAGSVGLTCSALLAMHNIRSLVVERQRAPSILPRAAGIHIRSMEIFRTLCVEDAIRARGVDARGIPLVSFVHTLAEGVQSRIFPDFLDPEAVARLTPSPYCYCTEDRIGQVLLAAIRDSGMAEVRYGTELLELEQDATEVCARIRSASRPDEVLRASYVIAADGAHSGVRKALGIEVDGYDEISHELLILFRADLSQLVRDRQSVLFRVDNEHLHGFFRSGGEPGRWLLQVDDYEGPSSPDACVELVRNGAGDERLPVELVAAQPWIQVALVARSFQRGRIFLAGDAAHALTPGGALGMNTGLQDAQNLTWKIAFALQGAAGEGLLSTYEAERRPVALQNAEVGMHIAIKDLARVGQMMGVLLGFHYDSAAVIADGTEPPAVDDPLMGYVPCARPGHRAPHTWIEDDGRRVSTLDVFGRELVLLSPAGSWLNAGRDLERKLSIPLRSVLMVEPGWQELYGVGPEGAVLVRPDGHVAWRSAAASPRPAAYLQLVLNQLLARRRSTRDSSKQPMAAATGGLGDVE